MLGASGLQVRFGQVLCGFLGVLVAPQFMQIMHEPVIVLVSVCLVPHVTDILWFDSVRCTDLDMAPNTGSVSIRGFSMFRNPDLQNTRPHLGSHLEQISPAGVA